MFRDTGGRVAGLGEKQVKQGFVFSVTIFIVKVLKVFAYFCCFPDYVGLVAVDIDYDFCGQYL